MGSPLERKLVVITGKGGVGKTTVASAIGMLGASRGLRTLVVEVGDQDRVPALFGRASPGGGAEIQLRERLWSTTIDPDRALLEWLQALGGRISGRLLASSSTFQYFSAAAPGAKELVSMVKLWNLTGAKGVRAARYDVVVLDAPATGHALGMLQSPQTFGTIARVGPVAAQARQVRALLEDPARCSYIAVTHATELAVTETLELQGELYRLLERTLQAVVINGVLPLRFTAGELRRLRALEESGRETAVAAPEGQAASGSEAPGAARETAAVSARRRPAAQERIAVRERLLASATHAARAVHDRSRMQHNQIARLRRRDFEVLGIPFQFVDELDLEAVGRIAQHLGRKL